MQENFLNDIKIAWETYVKKDVITDIVSPTIAESWERSKKYGVNYISPNNKIASGDELESILEKNKKLIKIAKPIIANLSSIVKGTESSLVLIDADGYLIDNIGDEEVKRRVWHIGTKISEDETGTSGPAICLKSGKTIQVVGAEHYCSIYHNWVCSTAPIHNQDGKLIGVLSMIANYKNSNKYTLGVVVAAAYSIEKEIFLKRSYELITTTGETISDGLIITNRDFIIIGMNNMAEKILGVKREIVYGINIEDIIKNVNFDEIFTMNDMFLEKIHCEFTIENRNILCLSQIKAVVKNNEIIGISILFKEMKYFKDKINILSGNRAIYNFKDIITVNNQMKKVIREAQIFSKTKGSILIEGESGTGKELFAHSIHNYSFETEKPFVAVNCASIPRDLVESELFGYEAGTFTGASRNGKTGKFELANEGTIFLDEIGELPLDIQAKLLRVLDSHTITKIGGKSQIQLDVRVIAATNRNIQEEVNKRNFREDLYYRLNVFKLNIPPLRERIEDVEVSAQYFLKKLNTANYTNKKFDYKVLTILEKYIWKGNVRELQNVIERSYYLSDGDIIKEECLPEEIINMELQIDDNQLLNENYSTKPLEKKIIENALIRTNGHIIDAGILLNMSRTSIYRKINEYGIDVKLYR
ncbi:MAG: sigma-54-dependent Fis family transcriptional regulator [Sedimentibacter sp.]